MHELRQSAGDVAPPVSLLTTRDVAALIRVDKSTIYRMAEDGRLPAVKVGRQWRFPEDQLLAWLGRRAHLGSAAGISADLRDLITPQALPAITGLFSDLLGVMVLVTDMSGRPLAEVGNPCGLFAAAHLYPGVMERCISGWREMAGEPDLQARWQPTPLGFLCARTLVRVGDQLKGMVLAGGIAPADWPPEPPEVERLAAGLGIPVEAIGAHLDEVYRLGPEEQQRVLRLLPRLGAFLSRLAGSRQSPGERAGDGLPPSSPVSQRSNQ
jgi:excisionase family DNA binding protein